MHDERSPEHRHCWNGHTKAYVTKQLHSWLIMFDSLHPIWFIISLCNLFINVHVILNDVNVSRTNLLHGLKIKVLLSIILGTDLSIQTYFWNMWLKWNTYLCGLNVTCALKLSWVYRFSAVSLLLLNLNWFLQPELMWHMDVLSIHIDLRITKCPFQLRA